MGKSETAASSLVMAVPAGILCYLTIMAGLQSTENMPTVLMGVVWATAVLSFLLALFPLGIFAFMKSGAAPAAGTAAPATEASEPKSVGLVEEGDLEETTDLGDVSEADSEVVEEDAFGEVEDLGDLDDDLQVDDDAFEMDDIEEEEEAPKKKKKK